MSDRQTVVDQGDSVTPLVRPGDWDYATEEIVDDSRRGPHLAEGVVDETLASFKLYEGYARIVFWRGTEQADHEAYVRVKNAAGTIQIEYFGMDLSEAEWAIELFDRNPFVIGVKYND